MNYAIILAGGTGSRAGSDIPKQFVEAGGKPIIEYCIDIADSSEYSDGMIVVCENEYRNIVKETTRTGKHIDFADPGKTRQLSIVNALLLINDKSPENGSTVMIYDAARPYITTELTDSMYEAIGDHDGVMPVLPMKDTVYECENGKITALLQRSKIYAGQAPELFVFDKYLSANLALLPDEIHKINGSSEPAVIAGMDIITVPGDERNIKITTRKDLEDFARK